MAPLLSPPGFLGCARGAPVLLLALGPSALAAAPGSHSPCTHKPAPLRSCQRQRPPARHPRGQSSHTKSAPGLRCLLATATVTANEHSKAHNFHVAFSQLLRCLNLEWKLKEIEQQNKLNLSFSGEN